jgi:deoxycytidylate deaminase
MPDSIQKIKFPELIFGFVAPIGADLEPALAAFRTYFTRRSYKVVDIKVTDVFSVLEKYNILCRYIAYGNQLRARFGDAILAMTTIRRVMARRLRAQKEGEKFSRTVFLFFQVSTYSRRGARVDYLSRRFASSDHTAGPQKYRHTAEELIQIDENEIGALHGQRVASIFHDADLIISLDDAVDPPKKQIERFCELIFGSNSISPTRSEYGMFLAKAAALRTLDLSRQVGAAIFSKTGEILALGSNEVPKAGGGTYWADDKFDDRDYKRNN